MALAGNIKEFGLADIFQIVSLQQKTGVLTVENAKNKVTVLLEKGLIVGADASFRPVEERLQQSLLQSHQISKFQLKRATETQKKTHQPLWSTLAELKVLDTDSLKRALSQQIHETIYQLLRWTEGDYRFEPRKVEYDHNLVSPVNTEFLIMEGFRITDEWSLFEQEIPSLQVMVRRNSDVDAPPEDLPEAEMKVYQLLESEKTIQDVSDMGQLAEFDTCQTVYELMKKGLVEKVPGKQGKTLKVRRASFDVSAFFAKAAVFLVGIGLLIGVIVLLRILPKNTMLVHNPHATGFSIVKPFAAQSQLHNLAYYISIHVFEHGVPPATLEELVRNSSIPSETVLEDPWGQAMMMTPGPEEVTLRSTGKDMTPGTEDDITLTVPL
jgi:hypothetical protein